MPFMEWVESGYFLKDMISGNDSTTSAWNPMLHLSVLAIGSRYIKNDLTAVGVNLDELEKNLVVAAKQRLILVEMEKPSLAVIRGIICLAALINSNGDNRQAWLLLGLAVRMSEDSGLVQPATSTPSHLYFRCNPESPTCLWSASSVAYSGRGTTSQGFTSSSQTKCITAAKEILHIARQYNQVYGLSRPNQTFSLNFWIAGTVLLLAAAQSPSDKTARSNLARVIEDLKRVGSVWVECLKCADILLKLQESWITEVEVPPRETDIDNFFEMLQADDPTFPTSFGWPKSGLSVIR
ncbi:hypothetical protein I317_06181 [Kwoniella heveanensis CBS 569]|nr:hypothetical protein I317_06181 [Kwoniella heveanensis CBS 569]